MHTHAIPRLLLVGLALALLVTGLRIAPTAADTGARDWSNSESKEDVFVHACEGFVMTTSYTTHRTHHTVTNYSSDVILERLHVTVVGVLTNATNGQSLLYDGKFTRTSYYHIGRVTVSDLELRIQLPTPGDWKTTIAQQEMDLVADPVAVIQTVASRQLESGLCVLLGRSVAGEQAGAQGPIQPGEAADNMTPWTELDSCDTSPPGQLC
jgi:hypothetical protein